MTERLDSLIKDTRKIEDFSGLTFSGFKKSQVKKTLFQSLNKGNLESSNYWVAEYICCGAFLELWDTLLKYASQHIHLGNPKLPIYISKRFQDFKNIALNEYANNQLDMRNSKRVRQLFAEITSILCNSIKKNKIEYVRLEKQGEFDITNISHKVKAVSTNYAQEVMLDDDPKELFIAINELGYNISKGVKNTLVAYYWVEWILAFELACKKKKEKCICAKRDYMPVEGDAMFDVVFLIWDVIKNEIKKRNDTKLEEIIRNLCQLFCIRFSSSVKKKRKILIYHAITLLCENINYNIKVFDNIVVLEAIKKKIDLIYKQIKVNEIVESEEELRKKELQDEKKGNKNFENTLYKLNIMKNNDII